MANAYSLLNNYDEPTYSPDFGLIAQTLQYKQSNLNQNRASLQKYYNDTIDSLRVMRDVDKNYINERVQAVTSLVNQYANQDLSSAGLTQALQQDLGQIIDDNVKNAVSSTAIFQAEQKAWKKLQEEDAKSGKGLYSITNHQYASQKANDWLNSDDLSKTYNGGGGVIAFTDVNKKILDNVPKLLKDTGKYQNVVPSKDGFWYDTVSGQRISQGDVSSAISSVLSQKDKEQLAINAWGTYKDTTTENLAKEFDSFKNSEVSKIQNEISSLNKVLENKSLTQSEKGLLNNQISLLENQKSRYDRNFDLSNPGQRSILEQELYNKKFFDNYTNMFAIDDRNIEVKRQVNTIALEKMKQQFQIDKETVKALGKTNKKNTKGDNLQDSDDLNPSSVNFVNTDTEDKESSFTKISGDIETDRNTLVNQGIIPNIYEEGVDSEEILNKIMNYDGSLKFNGQDITQEQSDAILRLEDNYNKMSLSNNITDVMEKQAGVLLNAVVASDDFEDGNQFEDYGFKVILSGQGEKPSIQTKNQDDPSYGDLINKRRRGETLTGNEKATLEAYNNLNYAKSAYFNSLGTFGGESKEDNFKVNSFLIKQSEKYQNGKNYLPLSTTEIDESDDLRIDSFRKKYSETLPFTNSTEFGTALDKIQEELLGGTLILDELDIPEEVEKLADKIKNESDITKYQFTDEDKESLKTLTRKFNSRPIFNKLKRGDLSFSDRLFSDLEGTDFELEGEGFFDKEVLKEGTDFGSLYKNTIGKQNLLQDLDAFNKGVQNFSFTLGPEKKTLRTEIVRAVKAKDGELDLELDDKSDIFVEVDKNNVATVYGRFKQSQGKQTDTPVFISKEEGFTVPAEKLQGLGLDFKVQRVTTYNTQLGEKATIKTKNVNTSESFRKILGETLADKLKNSNYDLNALSQLVSSSNKNFKYTLRPSEDGTQYVGAYDVETGGTIENFVEIPSGRQMLQINTVREALQEAEDIDNNEAFINSYADFMISKAIGLGIIEQSENLNSQVQQSVSNKLSQ